MALRNNKNRTPNCQFSFQSLKISVGGSLALFYSEKACTDFKYFLCRATHRFKVPNFSSSQTEQLEGIFTPMTDSPIYNIIFELAIARKVETISDPTLYYSPVSQTLVLRIFLCTQLYWSKASIYVYYYISLRFFCQFPLVWYIHRRRRLELTKYYTLLSSGSSYLASSVISILGSPCSSDIWS